MRQFFLLLFFLFPGYIFAQKIAIKNNLLYDITATPNFGVEFGVGKHFSIDLSGGYHPWSFKEDKSLKHMAVQPELRYWFFERFQDHFIGLHIQYMDYDFSGFDLLWGMDKEFRYDGDARGVGLSYGYQLYLSPRWNIEFTLGGGFNHFTYTKYTKEKVYEGKFKRDYFGFTKLGISIVYLIK